MKTKMYAVYDAKVKAFNTPIHYRNAAEATRSFADACNDPKTTLCQHPEDYQFFEIGEYDDENGVAITYETKIPLGLASQFKKLDKPILTPVN